MPSMKTVYEKAGKVISDMVQQTMLTYHPTLAALEPVIAILIVRKIDDEGNAYHALKHHGAEAAAVIKKVSTKKRTLVEYDLELEIDGFTWDAIPVPSRTALIDHELNHVVIIADANGVPKTDDLGRHRYALRPDDYSVTGFFCIAERHGTHALEAKSDARIHERMLIALNTAAVNTAAAVAARIPAA